MTSSLDTLSHTLVRALPFGFDIVAPDGTVLYISERQEQLLGKDAVGKKCWDLYRDDRTQCEHCPLRQGVAPDETAMITSSGVLGGRTFHIYHTGLFWDGQPAVLEIFHDISAIRRAEERRLTSETKLQLLIDQVPALLWTVDPDLRFTSSGGAALAALGLRPGQVVGMTLFEYFGTDDPTFEAIDMHRHAMETGTRVSFDFEWVDNSYEVVLEPLLNQRGKVTGCLGIAVDVTERKRADEVLRRSEAKYRGLVEHANYGIYRSSPVGRFLAVNPALVEMLGYDSEAELMAVDMERDVYANPAERPRLVEQYRERGRIDDLELEWRRKDGRTITVRVSGRPIHAASGELEFFEMIVQDVSEQRRLEAQLRQAQKMEAIGQLTGGIAHDFNNLLSVITLNAQLAAASLEATQGEVVPELEDIQEAARKATTMTKQLLGFSRHADLRMVPTDLARVVTKLSSMMRRVLPENIGIRIDTDEALHAVRADAGAVEQMLLNLATNARDAMPEGGKLYIQVGEREVSAETLASHPWITPGPYVYIRVRDSGIGMDEETRSKIFEPFFTTKAPGVGTGLGMAMVYGLTKQHGGFVTVQTRVGKGTTVELYFPTVGEAARPLESAESLEGVRGGKETILLVEDEDTLRRSAKRVLERYGYTVLVAADGQEALELFRAHKREIDLVVSDLVMPRVGGAQLHRVLQEEGGDVRFLLASGYVGRESGGHQPIDPSIPMLRKPWALGELLVQVRELLDRA
ncbi:MAG: PAS domain S-box protein [Gemmatimonadota bacterium]|nr:MAG: PAS domain S-box protein [Gemmatimonadota bacterium]